MKPLPMPIRIAAGLVATAFEEVQELPRKITELPVTAVSQALQASMRLQQRVTELAIKGDRALGALRPVPETPTWARFDEDDELPPPRNGLSNGLRAVDTPRPPKVTPVRILPAPEPEDFLDEDDVFAEDDFEPGDSEPEASELPVPRPPAEYPGAAKLPEPKTAPVLAEPEAAPAANGPPGMPEYDSWSLPQLRGRFRALNVEQLERLLAWETSHQDRPPFVTMLSNRIASVTGR